MDTAIQLLEISPAETKKINKEIQRRNRLFKSKTKAQKRVLIAKDVIAQIQAKKIRASSGDWVANEVMNDLYNIAIWDESEKISVQKLLLAKASGECSCCALGGLMVSCTLFTNKETLENYHERFASELGYLVDADEKFDNGLNKIFSRQQLQLIEIAFEGGEGYFIPCYTNLPERLTYKATEFHDSFDNSKDRLIGIMENIIKNKGTFKP